MQSSTHAVSSNALAQPANGVRLFWWVFAVRGGLAAVFAVVLFLASSFLGIFFFDPVTLVYMSLLLASYVLSNALILGVATAFALEHKLHIWWLTLCEASFALLFGLYIGVSLMITSQSLAWFAGLHALGTGILQIGMAIKLKRDRPNWFRLAIAALISLTVGVFFLLHAHQAARTTTQLLSGYELFYGIVWVSFAFGLRKSHENRSLPTTTS